MSLFPTTPSDGDVFVHPNGRTYEFHSEVSTWSVVHDSSHSHTQPFTVSQVSALNTLQQTSFLILE